MLCVRRGKGEGGMTADQKDALRFLLERLRAMIAARPFSHEESAIVDCATTLLEFLERNGGGDDHNAP